MFIGQVASVSRSNKSVPSSGFKGTMRMEPIGCPETSVRNYHYSLRNNPEERSSQMSNISSYTVQVPLGERNYTLCCTVKIF
jgi:hypothetical protein